MKHDFSIEAFILAGGKSTRMGRDKGLVLLNGKPMLSYVLETLEKVNIPKKIIANDAAYNCFGLPVYPDVVKEKGPMGGLLTSFENTEADVIFLISCDMPLVSVEAVDMLISLAEKESIVAATAEERLNPLFALYPVHLKQQVKNCITRGELKMTDFILKNKHTLVSSIHREMPWVFRNINYPDELKRTEEKWNHLK